MSTLTDKLRDLDKSHPYREIRLLVPPPPEKSILGRAADEIERLSAESGNWKRLADDAEELFSHIADDSDVEMWRRSYRAIQNGDPNPFGAPF